MNAQGPKEKADAENMLSSTLKSLFAVSESYPDIKSSNNFLELQRELRDTEDKILASRRFYNSVVRDYNITITKFPALLIANTLGFEKKDFFELDEEELEVVKKAPEVKF
jgi:LemA protein